jgi:hypothetical protein
VVNVTSGMSQSTIQAVINGAGSGNTVVFAPGTYNLTNLELSNGVNLLGSPGAILRNSAGAGATNGIITDNPSGVSAGQFIAGFTFNPNGGMVYPAAEIQLTNGSSHVKIIGNTLPANPSSGPIIAFSLSNSVIEANNLGSSAAQQATGDLISIGNFSGNGSNIIYGNYFTNMGTGFGIEHIAKSGNASDASNTHIDYNLFTNGSGAIAISVVNNGQTGGANNTVWGNVGDALTWLVETVENGVSIEYNASTHTSAGIEFGAGASEAENNSFANFTVTANCGAGTCPFGQTGGYNGTEWVGNNLWNGTLTAGWPSRSYGARPFRNTPITSCQ